MPQLTARNATEADIPQLLEYIRALAAHEGRPAAAVATPEGLRHWLLEKRAATALMLEAEGTSAGYALFYPTFSTFQGACNLYLEDVYIRPELRGAGLGQQAMALMLETAKGQGYAALQWSCLNTNAESLQFYEGLGAKRKPQGTNFYLPTV